MRKVFIFELKRMIAPLAIYLGIMSIATGFIILPHKTLHIGLYKSFLSYFMILLFFGSILYSFSYNKKRISADAFYSLPVTKRELFIGKYFAAITGIFTSTILYIIICILFMCITKGMGDLHETISLGSRISEFCILASFRFLMCIPIFHFLLLFYYKANTILDGIIYWGIGMILAALVPLILLEAFQAYTPLPSFFLQTFINGFDELIFDNFNFTNGREFSKNLYISIYSIEIILGYLLIAYLLWNAGRDSALRTQNLCDGIFGYKVFLPLLAILIHIWQYCTVAKLDYLAFILVAVGIFIGYCVYHRSPKFSKVSYISYGVVIGVSFILALIF